MKSVLAPAGTGTMKRMSRWDNADADTASSRANAEKPKNIQARKFMAKVLDAPLWERLTSLKFSFNENFFL